MSNNNGVDVYFNITQPYLKEKHVCYFVAIGYNKYNRQIHTLKEVVERTYKHPQAPEHATISQNEIKCLYTSDDEKVIAALYLLYNAQQNINNIIDISQ